ncbi:hypothetical protein OH460_01755 [Vibrio sp. Makdt]|uniref:hypothetical protein n=1 Tax=Vibrio sp. Makdt TaxID=2998828 RepID=UPI0022CDBB85|nr:hypothetical protein [Vibrio sp. Makdt]MDA0151028.1 hypothetical protein [Vibrio sp. Makdt]
MKKTTLALLVAATSFGTVAATPSDNWGFTLRVYLPDVADVQDWEANMPDIKPLNI